MPAKPTTRSTLRVQARPVCGIGRGSFAILLSLPAYGILSAMETPLQTGADRQESVPTERRLIVAFGTLCELGTELSRARSFDELCRLAVTRGCDALGFDRMGLWFSTNTPLEIVGSYGTDEAGGLRDERKSRLRCNPTSDMGRMLVESRPLVHVERTSLMDHEAKTVGHGTHVLASLWDGERIIGCLSADDLLGQHPIGEVERHLLQMYATTVGHLCTRRRAEDALAEAREEQRKLLEIVDRSPAIAVRWRSDDDGRVEFASRNVDRLGYSPDDFLSGRVTWMDILHPSDQPRLRAEVKTHVLQAGGQWSQRYRLRTREGTYRSCEGRHRVITDPAGAPTHIEAIFLDVSERRELELRVARTSLQERAALGAALHDSLGQELTGLAFLASATAKLGADTSSELKNAVEEISDMASRAVAHARRIARGLAPVNVSGIGLAAALHELAEGTSRLYGIPCRFNRLNEAPVFDGAVADNLYYMAVESVSNAVRHAEAESIQISLDTGREGRLTILDDGRGFGPATAGNGLGLHILHYRAEQIGAVLTVTPAAGKGTLVECRFSNVQPTEG